jgi:5-aminopentanamidase
MLKEVRIKTHILKYPPAHGEGLRLAVFQAQRPVGTIEAVQDNLKEMENVLHVAKSYQVDLVSFPELYITGYSITPKQLKELAETTDGDTITQACNMAKKYAVAIVYPYPEAAQENGETCYYDSIALIGANGKILFNYRKIHLYGAAERKNYKFGNELPKIAMINGFNVGILNCYECEFPSLYKHLAGLGAQIVIGPTAADGHYKLTNLDDKSKKTEAEPTLVSYPDATKHIMPAMAGIYRMFVCYSNRRGWENVSSGSWEFKANSSIFGPEGKPLLKAKKDDQMVDLLLIADCIPKNHQAFSPEGNHLDDDRLAQFDKLELGK